MKNTSEASAKNYQDDCPEPESTGHSTLIREMAVDERPREKALRHGIKTLSDAELMAILFSTGTAGMSVIDLCRRILKDHDNHLSQVARQSAASLYGKYNGVGPAKAITLLAALELGSRAAADSVRVDNPTVSTSKIAADIMRPHFSGLTHEEMWVMLLAQNGKVIAERRISEGGLGATLFDLKKLLKIALDHYATSIILFHNHPSGTLLPSTPDDQITRRVAEGCRAIDLRFNDHIIVTENSHYSYSDEGRLPR